MCRCVLMIDRTLATLSLMQRQAEFRSLSIGRKMLFRYQIKTTLDLVYVRASVYRLMYQLKNDWSNISQMADAQIKEVWHITLLSGKDVTKKLLNNRTLAWRIGFAEMFISIGLEPPLHLKFETERRVTRTCIYGSSLSRSLRQRYIFFFPFNCADIPYIVLIDDDVKHYCCRILI